jgi:ParB family chromosome partitioning protein
VASVKSKGVIEPITVRFIEEDGNYRIVTGERRFKAAKMAGLKEIPCIVKGLNGQEALTYQSIENLQREDLSPIDEAAATKKLLDADLTQVRISKLIAKSQPYVSQILKILELPQTILKQAQSSGFPKEHLLQLVKAQNPEALWQEIKEAGATAKEIKQKIDRRKPTTGRPKAKLCTWRPENKSFTILINFRKEGVRPTLFTLRLQ